MSEAPSPPSSSSGLPVPMVDLSKPRYDQKTYVGRAKHFFETANPMNVFVSRKRLEEAAKLIRAYKWVNVTKILNSMDQIRQTFVSGLIEKVKSPRVQQLSSCMRPKCSMTPPTTLTLGRRCSLLVGCHFKFPATWPSSGVCSHFISQQKIWMWFSNKLLNFCGILFYRSPAAVIFWQWMNQTFNSIVNYTNRSGDQAFTTKLVLCRFYGTLPCMVNTVKILFRTVLGAPLECWKILRCHFSYLWLYFVL